MVYPKENSVAVAVFTVALTIDVLAVLKLVKPRMDRMLFHSVICAASSQVVRAFCRLSVLYVVGCLWGFLVYYEISRVVRGDN
ncbi:hypothetical protein LIER_08248 [Lithospermum erythrorhizon]|uniref:Uncharacterized protein n=1 Tax=Lithospermum erythrorhizon TaxID=34254 RepID=A0AAV3PCK3_LITER